MLYSAEMQQRNYRKFLKEYKAKNVMVVYDAGVKMAGIATKVLEEIENADVKITVFDGVIPIRPMKL